MNLDLINNAYAAFSTEHFPDVSEEQVAAMEEQLGVRLPEDYRQFLLAFNGGMFDEPGFDCEDEFCRQDGLTCLYGIQSGDSATELGDSKSIDLMEGNDPLGFLPIGYTASGGMLLLVVEADGRGGILLKEAFGGFHWLADGIEELFGMLREDDEE